MNTENSKKSEPSIPYRTASVSDMTVGSPLHQITKFALPLILGYILQQMYLVIDAAIVGTWCMADEMCQPKVNIYQL